MFCDQCKNELPDKDFLKTHPDICYRCLFKNKEKLFSDSSKALKICRICKEKIPEGKDKYCSDECAHLAKTSKDKNYWVRKCNAPQINWKR